MFTHKGITANRMYERDRRCPL